MSGLNGVLEAENSLSLRSKASELNTGSICREPKESKSKPNNKKASPPKLLTEQCDVCMVDVSKKVFPIKF